MVIAEMLGVPPEDRDDFKRWSDPVARTLEPTITPEQTKQAQQAFDELSRYFQGIVAEREKEPREDLVSALIAAEESGDRLSRPELLSTLRLLLVAGNETTTNLIGNGMLALLRNPDQLERLRKNMALRPRRPRRERRRRAAALRQPGPDRRPHRPRRRRDVRQDDQEGPARASAPGLGQP